MSDKPKPPIVLFDNFRSGTSMLQNLALFKESQVLRLRYEDFVQDPITHIQHICTHCGLKMTDEVAAICVSRPGSNYSRVKEREEVAWL